jgi:cytochrome c-type biogenesis protein CcmH/NrfG
MPGLRKHLLRCQPTMPPSDDLHARAVDLLLRGDTAGGISDLKTYLATDPDDEQAWLELGTAYAAIAHWPDAARALATAVELDGSVPDARLAYARSWAWASSTTPPSSSCKPQSSTLPMPA